MEKKEILYYDGNSARASIVRVLVFNDNVNLYDPEHDQLICSYPLKGAHVNHAAAKTFVYLNAAGTTYIELDENDEQAAVLTVQVRDANDNFIRKFARQRLLVLAAIMIAFIVGMYFLIITLVPAIGSAMISRETEKRIGDQLHQSMLAQEKLLGSKVDTVGTSRLQAFADEVKLSSNYDIRLTLVQSKVVNAYAMPGGHVVVYTGLLDKIKDPETLVALLAHEAAHVNERHTLRSMLRSAADALLLSVVFGDASGVTATLVGHAETLRGLDYSRSIETQADEHGMQLMLRNHVNVTGMIQLMEILQKEGDVPESVSFLSSHPLTKQRMKAAKKFIETHPQDALRNTRIIEAFSMLKKK